MTGDIKEYFPNKLLCSGVNFGVKKCEEKKNLQSFSGAVDYGIGNTFFLGDPKEKKAALSPP